MDKNEQHLLIMSLLQASTSNHSNTKPTIAHKVQQVDAFMDHTTGTVDSAGVGIRHLIQSIADYIDQAVLSFLFVNYKEKDVTFEQLRESMDENKLIESALKFQSGDEQPMLTGFSEWILEAQTKEENK